MKVILENENIKLYNEKNAMSINFDNENLIFSSNDSNGLRIKKSDSLWITINKLFNDLMNSDDKIVRKYQDYLVSVVSEENFARLVLAKVFDDYIISTVCLTKKPVKINVNNNESGRMLLYLYKDLLMYTNGYHQMSFDDYGYTLTKKNVG